MSKKPLERFLLLLIQYKKHLIATGALLLVVSLLKLLSYILFNQNQNNDYADYFDPSLHSYSIQIPKNLRFAGESLPLKKKEFRIAMENELLLNTFWNTHTNFLHRRASRWFPVIEPILKANGIPDDFKYIAIVESQLTNVISKQGATGFWQLLGSTAERYGLEVDGEVDERYHVAKATNAACKYFKEAYAVFHNWTLVAASYNLGIGGIQSKMEHQEKSDFFELHLPAETQRYLFKILAIKEIIGRPAVYGYTITKRDQLRPLSGKTIHIDTTIHNLDLFASARGIEPELLKSYNPWLISNSLTAKDNKKYLLLLPPKGLDSSSVKELLKLEHVSSEKDTVFSPDDKTGRNDSTKLQQGASIKESDNL